MAEFTVNTTNFDRGLQRLIKSAVPEALEKGLAAAGMQLINDAMMESPTVPLDEGTLRGSGSVHVQGRLVMTSEGMAPVPGTPCRDALLAPLASREMVAVIAFNTVYAAHLHEHPEFNFIEPGSGGKYLESKLERHAKEYMAIVADHLRGEMG